MSAGHHAFNYIVRRALIFWLGLPDLSRSDGKRQDGFTVGAVSETLDGWEVKSPTAEMVTPALAQSWCQ